MSNKLTTILVLSFCLIVGFFLRAYNLNWDSGLLFHPDERNIANAVTKIIFFKQLNPGFFAYGRFSIYLYAAAANMLVNFTKDATWIMDWGKVNLIGRFFSSVFSTLTIIPLYFVAKKLFDRYVGLLASLFYAFTVTSIQHAHFATTESSLVFFAIVLCLLSLLWFEKITIWKTLIFGAILGIALATKTSGLAYFIFPIVAGVLYILSQRKHPKKILLILPHIVIFLIATSLLFFILSPYTILDSKDFLASMQYESGVATGSLPVVYTLQFNGSIPYLFQIENFVWQFGPLLTIFGVAGLLLLILEPQKRKQINRLLFWIFPLIYFLYVGSWHTKFLRYMTPMVPFLIISGSYFLVVIWKKMKRIGMALILLTLITTILWAGAFFSIYTRPQTRVSASQWIYNTIPQGSKILTEAWDDGLPVTLGSSNGGQYVEEQLDMYAPDNEGKIVYLSDKLSHADYIAINSRRIYGTLTRLTNEYPITSTYYKLLFAGKLGYSRVATFTSYPQLFGLTINDDRSEETFQVYDHPKVIIFKNTKHYSQKELEEIL